MRGDLDLKWHDIQVNRVIIVPRHGDESDTTIANHVAPENTASTDLYACIGFMPKPGCGTQPVDHGQRGGNLQLAIFGLILLGLGIIVGKVIRSTKKRNAQE